MAQEASAPVRVEEAPELHLDQQGRICTDLLD
jgi:hypothetical protein